MKSASQPAHDGKMCRRKNCAPMYDRITKLFYLFLLYNTYIHTEYMYIHMTVWSLSIFGVLLSWFNRSFLGSIVHVCTYEYMYNTYLIEVSGENKKIPISRTIYLEARKFSNSNYRHRAVLAMIYDMYILEYLRSKTLLSPPHAGITVRINVSASALLASLQLHMYLLAAPYLWPCTLRSPTLLSVEWNAPLR